jgi:WD40 repeat protein
MKSKSATFGKESCSIWLGLILALGCGMHRVEAQQLSTIRLDEPMTSAAVSPDGRYVAIETGRSTQNADGSWSNTESIQVLQPDASKVLGKIDVPSVALLKDAPLSSTDGFISYCDNGKYLAAYDMIGTVYVLNASTYRVESKIGLGNLRAQDAHGTVLGIRMACSAGGSVFAVSAYGGRFELGLIRLFALATGEQIAELNQDSSSGAEFAAVDLSPNGSKLAVSLQNTDRKAPKGPNVEIRETKQLRLLGEFSTGDVPGGLAFSGESEMLTVQEQPQGSSSAKQVLYLWNLESGKKEKQFSDAHLGVAWPISSSADGKTILGYLPTYRECRLCNGLEGRREVKEQQFAVWDRSTGSEIYRSEPFRPIVDPGGPRCVLSQDGAVVMVYWPDNFITPRLFQIRQAGQ